MTFGKRLRESRTAKQMTQKQLAAAIGAKHNSISNWENDINKPDPDMIELLCGILEITPNYLLATASDEFSPSEKLLVKRYKELDQVGQAHIDMVLDWETERVKSLTESQINEVLFKQPTRLMNYYYRLASAGTGQIIFDMPPTKRIEIPNLPKYKKADYAIGVNGSSMEPTFHDGDTLLVEMAEEISIGEIGIFLVDNESFVKQLGDGKLISLNPEYPNIRLNETAKCMGKVIGKL